MAETPLYFVDLQDDLEDFTLLPGLLRAFWDRSSTEEDFARPGHRGQVVRRCRTHSGTELTEQTPPTAVSLTGRRVGLPGAALRASHTCVVRRLADPNNSTLSRGANPQAESLVLDEVPDVFVMRALLEETGETFEVPNCRGDMTVRELKEELDLIAGIPLNLLQLHYLDQGVMMDDSTLNFHDVVPGGMISLCVWHYDGWTDLVSAAVEGDTSKLTCLGVVEDSPYQTPNSQYLGEKHWRTWVAQRAFMALYIASHRGRVEAVQFLLQHGANCLGRSPMGRTPLHVAVAMGQSDCISLLLKYGASTLTKDAKGVTPQAIAHQLNHRRDERQMFLSYWMTKSERKDPKDSGAAKALPGRNSGSGSTQ